MYILNQKLLVQNHIINVGCASRCFFLADISTVICDKEDKAKVLLGNVERRETPALRRIIIMDTFDATSLLEQAQGCGVTIQAMAEVEVSGGDVLWSV